MEHRPRVLAILPAFIPSTQICVVRPFLALHRAGRIRARITLESLTFRRDTDWADLAVFCRNTEPDYGHNLELLCDRNVPIIYDIDDNFFDIPEDAEVGAYHKDPERLAMLRRYLQAASLVRVYSQPMFEKVHPLNDRVTKVIPPIDPGLTERAQRSPGDDAVKIVYATSRGKDDLAPIFLPALRRVLREYPAKAKVHFWGFRPESRDGGFAGIHWHPVIGDYEKYVRQFSRVGFDIGLAPLKDDIFHRSKTNNKFREYGVCGIVGIYSDVDVYSNCISHGETGLLVPNDEESWYRALVTLIENRQLREKIASQAENFVRRHYSQEAFERIWREQIQAILDQGESHVGTKRQGYSPSHWKETASVDGHFRGHPQGRHLAGFKVLARFLENLAESRRHGIGAVLQQILFYLFNISKTCKLRISTSR